MPNTLTSSPRQLVLCAAAGLLGLAAPNMASAQVLDLKQSHGLSIPVSCKVDAVENTGASYATDWWYVDEPLNHVTGTYKGFGFQVDAFCWDGRNPGVSWRLRRESATKRATITGQVCPDVLNEDNQPLGPAINLPGKAQDPDVTVGRVVVKELFVTGEEEGAWGRGDYYLIVGYHLNVGAGNQARLNIYRIQEPRYYSPTGTSTPATPTTPNNLGAVLMEETPGCGYSADLGPGQNVNVDFSNGGDGEFAFTYVANGNGPVGRIMGGVGKTYQQLYGQGSGNGPAYHTAITQISQAAITQFYLPQSLENSQEPDVAYASHYTHRGVASFVWNSADRRKLSVAGVYMGTVAAIQPTGGTTISMPVHLIHEEDNFAATNSLVYKPRIESYDLVLGSVRCKVVYKEEQELIKGDCDLGNGIPALQMVNLLTIAGADITDPADAGIQQPATYVRTAMGSHVNRCMAAAPFTADAPAIASVGGGSGAALVYWTAFDASGASLLKDEDIVAHNIQTSGFPVKNYGGYYNSFADHYRINNNQVEAGWNGTVDFAGNQRAVSLAPEGKSAWYDARANRIISHDVATNPSGYRPAAPAADGATKAEPATPKSTLLLLPSPSGKGALIRLAIPATETITKLMLLDVNTGAELAHLDSPQLPARLSAESVELPLARLLPASLRQGVFVVKAITNRSTYSTRLLYEPEVK